LVGTSFPYELPDRHSRSEASEPYERLIRVSSNQTALFRTAWSRCRLLEPRTAAGRATAGNHKTAGAEAPAV